MIQLSDHWGVYLNLTAKKLTSIKSIENGRRYYSIFHLGRITIFPQILKLTGKKSGLIERYQQNLGKQIPKVIHPFGNLWISIDAESDKVLNLIIKNKTRTFIDTIVIVTRHANVLHPEARVSNLEHNPWYI